jgi:streptomycin 6-kinase
MEADAPHGEIEEWTATVPRLLERCTQRWGLTVGPPYTSGTAGYVAPAIRSDGTDVVLKLIYPHREAEHEADALKYWNGEGAVRLIDQDQDGWALVLERCSPGSPVSAMGADAALDVFTSLLPRLWAVVPPHVFTSLADEAMHWHRNLRADWERGSRPFDERMLDATLEALPALCATQGEQVLLHQDLHGDNVLSAQREPWLAIDPKPLVGEREFGVAPILRSSELEQSRDATLNRLDRLCAELGLDRERAQWWTIAQTLAWSFDATYRVSTADWLFDDVVAR